MSVGTSTVLQDEILGGMLATAPEGIAEGISEKNSWRNPRRKYWTNVVSNPWKNPGRNSWRILEKKILKET